MKRGAERQISKDDADDNGAGQEVGKGLVRADEETLKRRPMRGLPKRGLNAAQYPSAAVESFAPEPAQTPKFSSFAGFGVASSSTTPFAPTPPIFASSQPAPCTPISASPDNESKSTSTAFPTSSTPALATNASQATKTFASAFNTTTPAPPQPAARSKSPSPDRDDPELWYYISLRGLNESLRRTIAKAIDLDPFVDMSDVFPQYIKYRAEAQEEFDAKRQAAAQSSSSTEPTPTPGDGATSAANPSSGVTTSAAKPSASMPTVPTGFAGFSAPSASASSSSKSGEGFKPTIDTPTTGASNTFAFGFKPTNSAFEGFGSGGKPKPSDPDTSSTIPPQPPLAFGAPSFSKAPDTISPPPAPESRHTFESSAAKPTDSAANPFAFGVKASNSSPFTFASPKPDVKDEKASSDEPPLSGPAPSANVFGIASSKLPDSTSDLWNKPSFSPINASSTDALGSSNKPLTNVFGSTDSTGGAFGIPRGSPGNPFGATSTPPVFGSSSMHNANPLGSSKASVPNPFSSPFATSGGAFKPSTSSANVFGPSSTTPLTNVFGPPSTPSVDIFGQPVNRESHKDKEDSKTSHVHVFGKTSEIGTPEKPVAATTAPAAFSTPPPKPLAGFGGFGKPVGSIGNPMGFGFGSPPKTPDAELASNPLLFVPPSSTGNTDEDTVEKASATPEAEDPSKIMVLSTSPHDAEGEGEEDEETTHQIKSHVYKMVKGDKGSSWGDMGVGMLRLKKHKDTGIRRVLLRNSSTGKITINFNIYAGMDPTVAEKVVSFMGHEDAKSTPYKLRLKTAQQASELKNAIDREIEFVKSKSE